MQRSLFAHALSRGIHTRHFNRPRNEYTERELSPQRMVFYRSNWYLECWCHTRKALRRFSLDAMDNVKMLGSVAKNVATKQIEEAFGGSYGIYGGKPKQHAVLRFSIHASRWVPMKNGIRHKLASLTPMAATF